MAMYARSNSLILSISADNIYQEPFAFRTMTRNSEPEIFTFDPTPVQTAQRSTPVRHRKRNTRVMYPSKVRKYLPPAEKSPIKRWLVILCLVVCLQIYSEEAYTEMPGAGDSPAADTSNEEPSMAQYEILPFQSAEQHARHIKCAHVDCGQEQPEQRPSRDNCPLHLPNTTCPDWDSDVTDLYEQSRRNSYVVALLYPVYHRLGSDN
ncbi:radiation-inducible immediate-early gene IEX-1 [Paramormyrops kingsleyae]|uniref:radiation-inducible immediate-early gene IEX-1 n=1 Tax=Paramormyrops kingsleyae TaxID=1676925 RepID=UPI000CD623E2|nr:radiation-inducible immediate-early gene IEX-1 [Paramormyrops kingsleyae]